ncbi:MAG: DUF4388 domain-containing protein [Myxococcales bacterium]|nr:DUF4388 domain-containing protein [Myxococcales bacterium]MCB9669625.1 DUF4388 domain-containing protein [Alphaproteobacteria bacterium]
MPDVLLAGNLGAVSLASLLQLADSDGLTGCLNVGGGELDLYDGVLVGARFHGLDGMDAAIEALVRASGPFRIDDVTRPPGTALMATHSLIVESFRVVDDLHRFGPMVLAEGTTEALPADGQRPVARLVTDHGLQLVRVLPALSALQDAGRLRPLAHAGPVELEHLQIGGAPAPVEMPTPVVETGPVVPALGFDDLLFQARRLARQRRFDEAIAHMNAALEQQPGSRIALQNLKRIQTLQNTAT